MSQPPFGPPPGAPGFGQRPQEQPFGTQPQPVAGGGQPARGPRTQAFTAPMGPPPGYQPGLQQQVPPMAPKRKKRWPWAVAAAVVVFGIGAAAGGGSDDNATDPASSSAAATTVTVTETAPAPSTAPAPAPAPAPVQAAPATTAAATPVVDFAMPNLVGVDLQTAQDTVQQNGVFFSVSHDLLGNRNQLVDSNWIVCDQNVAPGQQVTGDAEGQIDFGVVKRGEGCP